MKPIKKIIVFVVVFTILIFTWARLTKAGYIPNYLDVEFLCPEPSSPLDMEIKKPVIYLYPQKIQDVTVRLRYNGQLIADYPDYNYSIGGWNVTAYPDGHLIDHADGQEYSYLFWEGIPSQEIDWDLSKGFIVKGSETKDFLQKTLKTMGLTPREYNEFIVYWYPLMKDNPYNLIHFAQEQYTDQASLDITPKPDSLLRVFMVFKPLDKKEDIVPQQIKPFERKGFAVIEWGGTKLE